MDRKTALAIGCAFEILEGFGRRREDVHDVKVLHELCLAALERRGDRIEVRRAVVAVLRALGSDWPDKTAEWFALAAESSMPQPTTKSHPTPLLRAHEGRFQVELESLAGKTLWAGPGTRVMHGGKFGVIADVWPEGLFVKVGGVEDVWSFDATYALS